MSGEIAKHVAHMIFLSGPNVIRPCNEETAAEYIESTIRGAKDAALEGAALKCDEYSQKPAFGPEHCAVAIRAMKGKP